LQQVRERRRTNGAPDTVVRLMDVDPIEDAPSTRTIDRIKTAIANDLPKCRAEWWARVGTRCVDNRWTQVSRDGDRAGQAGDRSRPDRKGGL
jgi:hypothetical protein